MKIGIVGLGLIGGSLARALKFRTEHAVYGCDIAEGEVAAALLYGAIDGELTAEALAGCDALLLCAYPWAAIDYLTKHAATLRKGALVVDCGGVKRGICARGAELAAKHGFTFIGGHPMAGTPYAGFRASKADLFADATMLLTPDDATPIAAREVARDLFLQVGFGRVHFATAIEHDAKIAYTSQLAHIVSNAYVNSPTRDNCRDMAAGSFRDMTRVAKLNTPMWAELFLANADFLGEELEGLIERLQAYRRALGAGDRAGLEKLMGAGNAAADRG